MWIFALYALFCLVMQAGAYSTPGAYERLFIWYAYKIDFTLNNGVATKIAPGCAKAMRVGGTKCNFNQLVAYISNLDTVPNVAEDPTDIEATAKTLSDQKLTGQYQFSRIFSSNQAPYTVAMLWENVGQFVKSTRSAVASHGLSQTLTNCRTSIQRVGFYRKLATSDAVIERMTAKFSGIEIAYTLGAPFDGADKQSFFDKTTTKNNAVQGGLPGFDSATFDSEYNAVVDDSHQNNIKSISTVRYLTCGSL